MKGRFIQFGAVLSAALVFGLVAGGCGKAHSDKGRASAEDKSNAKKVHDHSGWWCTLHGTPEKECSMCSTKVAAEFKKKGDWCDKHDRAMSQCFICKPERKDYYAAKYRTKYGKEPPPIEELDEKKDAHKSKKEEKK